MPAPKVTLNKPEAAAPKPAPATKPSAVTGWEDVTDSLGRVLSLKQPSGIEQFDLLEVAGEASNNQKWFGIAMLAVCARSINNNPTPFPRTKIALRALVSELDIPGISAISNWIAPDVVIDASDVNVSGAQENAAKK